MLILLLTLSHQRKLESIEQVADEFVSAGFGNKIFFHKDLSSKLQQLWEILQDIYNNDPNIVNVLRNYERIFLRW